MFGYVVNAIVGAIVWALANVVYYDLKRKGVRNFARFAAFWVGNPTTWITLFVVKEERQPDFARHDEDALLVDIRRDRALRGPDDGASSREPDVAGVGEGGAQAEESPRAAAQAVPGAQKVGGEVGRRGEPTPSPEVEAGRATAQDAEPAPADTRRTTGR